jgi:hypothetical protein
VTAEHSVILAMIIYKLAALSVGSLFSLFGYRLFQSGIWGKSGDLKVSFKESRLVLTSAAPGTFFAVLGTVIIVFTLWQGLDFNLAQSVSSSKNPPALPDPKGLKP